MSPNNGKNIIDLNAVRAHKKDNRELLQEEVLLHQIKKEMYAIRIVIQTENIRHL